MQLSNNSNNKNKGHVISLCICNIVGLQKSVFYLHMKISPVIPAMQDYQLAKMSYCPGAHKGPGSLAHMLI